MKKVEIYTAHGVIRTYIHTYGDRKCDPPPKKVKMMYG